jgi:hypothetical protein
MASAHKAYCGVISHLFNNIHTAHAARQELSASDRDRLVLLSKADMMDPIKLAKLLKLVHRAHSPRC